MVVTDEDVRKAEERMAERRAEGYALAARHDAARGRLIVELSSGVELAIPVRLVEGLAGAAPADLAEIEISAGGLGLHWPRLDADVWVPGLMRGVFGSRRAPAAELGAAGGRVRSDAKAAAARENGRKGGRPRKAL